MSVSTPAEPLRAQAKGPPASVAALMDGLIDYAGLFPPAGLTMSDAVRRYHEYRNGPHAWALGRFVLPSSRLGEFETHAEPLLTDGAKPWTLSVLGTPGDRAILEAFNRRFARRAVIDAVETRAAAPEQVADAKQLAEGLAVYVEIPLDDDPEPLVVAVARNGLRAKVRTGGIQPEAFPQARRLARFLSNCVSANVPLKASAGLHHAWRGEYPLTYEPDSPKGTMFGFLNVSLAAVFARERLPVAGLEALLEERRGRSVTFDDDGIVWRGLRVHVPEIRAGRSGLAAGFGSCSFDEPMREMAALGLL